MGSISVACFRPRPGCEEALTDLVRNHLAPLRAEGLVIPCVDALPAQLVSQVIGEGLLDKPVLAVDVGDHA